MKTYWALVVTYMDVERNEFLTLGGAAFRTRADRDKALARIPATADVDSPYIVDVHSAEGCVDDRLISPGTAAGLLGRPVSSAIRNARRRERRQRLREEREWRGRAA